MNKKLIIITFMIVTTNLCAMEADTSTKIQNILTRAIQQGNLDPLFVLFESMQKRKIKPGPGATKSIRDRGLGAQLAFNAFQKNRDLVLEFLRSNNLISPESVRKFFDSIARVYFTDPGNIQVTRDLADYLAFATQINQTQVLSLNQHDTSPTGDTLMTAAARTLMHAQNQEIVDQSLNVIQLLLQAGTNPNIKNKKNMNPLGIATESEGNNASERAIEMLLEFGAGSEE